MWFENARDEMKYHVPFTGLNVPTTTGSSSIMHGQYHFKFAFFVGFSRNCLSVAPADKNRDDWYQILPRHHRIWHVTNIIPAIRGFKLSTKTP